MSTHPLKYGTLTLGAAYFYPGSSPGERGHFRRLDTYTCHATGEQDAEPLACLDLDDETLPAQHTLHGYPDFRDDYDIRCAACWVHRPHTLALHQANLSRAGR